MRRAYSYIRFSKPDQADGDSLRRQLSQTQAHCQRKGWLLDDTLCRHDKGVSAFRGKNATTGALAAFLEDVRTGRVPSGSVLIVESLDRLSRNDIQDAYDLFRGLLKDGIDIVTLQPEREYTRADLNNLVGLLEPLFIMSRAHEESETKSTRLREMWKAKRQRATTERTTSKCPAWLHPAADGKGFKVIPKAAKVVQRIYKLAREGYGQMQITAKLNDDKVPTIGRGKGYWRKGYVTKLLTTRAVVGEFQPHVLRDGKRVPDGKPIPDYFPAIMSEADWDATRLCIDSRKWQRGPSGVRVRNLFTGLIHSAYDGGTMVIRCNSPGRGSVPYLVGAGPVRGESDAPWISFPYPTFEDYFLRLLSQEQVAQLLQDSGGREKEIAALTGQLIDLDLRIRATKKKIEDAGNYEALLDVLADLEGKRKAKSDALERLRRESASNDAETLGEFRSLASLMLTCPQEELLELRTRIKARLRLLVKEIWVLVEGDGNRRVAHVQVFFSKGSVLSYDAQHPVFKPPKPSKWPAEWPERAPFDYPVAFYGHSCSLETLPPEKDLRTWRTRQQCPGPKGKKR